MDFYAVPVWNDIPFALHHCCPIGHSSDSFAQYSMYIDHELVCHCDWYIIDDSTVFELFRQSQTVSKAHNLVKSKLEFIQRIDSVRMEVRVAS